MSRLLIPPADATLKPFVGQYVVHTWAGELLISAAEEFTRGRGLRLWPVVRITGRNGVARYPEGQYPVVSDDPSSVYVRQRADVLAIAPSFEEAVAAARAFIEKIRPEPEEVSAA